jgi:type I restriction enzyme S subunit
MTEAPRVDGWSGLSFDDCVIDPGVRRKPVPRHQYLKRGIFPVIDQGQEAIGGYTDDANAVHQDGLPMILFGDHTRVFKFLDFPFAAGADGTKLFRANETRFDARFLYYALKNLDIPERGYNRHYSLLREMHIAFPEDKSEQSAIATVLDSVAHALDAQDETAGALKELKAATMAKLFREGLNGEYLVNPESTLPDGWRAEPVGNLGQIVTGTTPSTSQRENYGGDFQFIAPGDLGDSRVVHSSAKNLSQLGLERSRPLPPRSVLVVCIGSTIGKVGMTSTERSATNQQINAIIPRPDLAPEFVHYLMQWNASYIRSLATPGPVPILSKNQFAAGVVPVPESPGTQRVIAEALSAIDDRMEVSAFRRATLGSLFDATLRALMSGELRVTPLLET